MFVASDSTPYGTNEALLSLNIPGHIPIFQ
jgi:hypothetical protein